MAKSFNDLPPAVQVLILVVVAAGLSGGLFWYYVLPLQAKRDGLDAQVKRISAENLKNRAFEQERTEYLNRIAQLEKQLETLRTIVPDEQAADQFVRQVYDTARFSEINLRTFVAQPLQTKDFYTEMPFKVHLDGTYFHLLNFFDRLSHEPRIVSVVGLSLGGPQGGGMGSYKISPTETVGADCSITTYFNKPLATEAGTHAPKR